MGMSKSTCRAFRQIFEKYGYRELTFEQLLEESSKLMSPLTFRKYIGSVTDRRSTRPDPDSGNIHGVYLYRFKRNLTVEPYRSEGPFSITD